MLKSNSKDELINLDRSIFKNDKEYEDVKKELDEYYQKLKEKARIKLESREK